MYTVLIAICCTVLVATNALAVTNTFCVGESTHEYTTGVPFEFKLYTSVTYSYLYNHAMTIDSISMRIWNYDSDDNVTSPLFIATDGTYYHSTLPWGYMVLNSIAPNSSSYQLGMDWTSFVDECYPKDSNTYSVPSSRTNPGNYGMYTMGGAHLVVR